jgi:hypothetical protein
MQHTWARLDLTGHRLNVARGVGAVLAAVGSRRGHGVRSGLIARSAGRRAFRVVRPRTNAVD